MEAPPVSLEEAPSGAPPRAVGHAQHSFFWRDWLRAVVVAVATSFYLPIVLGIATLVFCHSRGMVRNHVLGTAQSYYPRQE